MTAAGPAPDLPATDRTFADVTVRMVHGPRGYRAVAIGGFLKLVFARTGWHPDIAAALADLSAAMVPALTRSAHRDTAPPDDDD